MAIRLTGEPETVSFALVQQGDHCALKVWRRKGCLPWLGILNPHHSKYPSFRPGERDKVVGVVVAHHRSEMPRFPTAAAVEAEKKLDKINPYLDR